MSINDLAKTLGDACYVFLAINFLWGLYNIIVGFRRVKELSFRNHDEQAEFMDEVLEPLRAGHYDTVDEMCNDDARALPQLIELAVTNRGLGYDQLRQVVTEVLQRDVMGDLEYRTNWIATVIKCGPLLGLFGTVLGMMAAFGRIGTGEKVQPSQIADEISIALICTAMGLGTAIPFNFMLASLTARIRRFQDALGAGLARALDVLKSRMLSEDSAVRRRCNLASAWAAPDSDELIVRKPHQRAARVRHHGDGRPGVHDEHLLPRDVRHRGADAGRSARRQPRRPARRRHVGHPHGRRRRRRQAGRRLPRRPREGRPRSATPTSRKTASAPPSKQGVADGKTDVLLKAEKKGAARRPVSHLRRRPRASKA